MTVHSTNDSGHGGLGFAGVVIECFRFLNASGFQLEHESEHSVRYRSNQASITIYHEPYSYEIGVEFEKTVALPVDQKSGNRFGLYDAIEFARNSGITVPQHIGGFQTSSAEGVRSLVPKLADLVKTYCTPFLAGDFTAYEWAVENRKKNSTEAMRQRAVEAARSRAEELWKAKQYEDTPALLEIIGKDRTKSEDMKLDYARKMRDSSHSAAGAKPQGATDEASAAASVQQMFNSIAPRYDLLNHVLSANIDKLWWRRTARRFRAVLANPESRILDICCGTGDMTLALLRHRPTGAEPILAADFAHAMLSRGAQKFAARPAGQPTAVALEADALHLPLRAASLDLVVSAFGFRNLANYEAGLREFHRVLKPGAQLGILDFSEPGGLIGKAYAVYFRRVLPAIGRLICGQAGPYSYLPSSVGNFPPPAQMLQLMRDCGYVDCQWQPYTFGIAGLYTAKRSTVA